MTWAHAWILLAFIPVCVLAALLQFLWRQHIRHKQRGIGSLQEQLCSTRRAWLVHLRFICAWLAILLTVVALAGPRWGSGDVKREAVGSFVVFAIDCSRSMLAEDLYPNRMQQAHFKALDFMKANPEHKVALLPFARIATLRTPFTGDHIAVEEMIKDCNPEMFPAHLGFQGTAIGASIIESCSLLQQHLGSSLAIIVFSDGSDKDTDKISEAAELANKHGIRIYGLFFGDTEREVTLDIDGRQQLMQADRSTLDQLAQATDAISVNATNDNRDIVAISNHIADSVTQESWQEQQRLVELERYQWFLLPALILLCCSLLLPSRSFVRHA